MFGGKNTFPKAISVTSKRNNLFSSSLIIKSYVKFSSSAGHAIDFRTFSSSRLVQPWLPMTRTNGNFNFQTLKPNTSSLDLHIQKQKVDDKSYQLNDVELFKKWNDSKQYYSVIARFESVYGGRNSSTWDRLDRNLVTEYVKAVTESHQLQDHLRYNHNGIDVNRIEIKNSSVKESDNSNQPATYWYTPYLMKSLITALLAISVVSVLIEDGTSNMMKRLEGNKGATFRTVTNVNTTFEDVKGCTEVKKELEEIVSYLTDPAKFTRLGAKLPKGILLTGPPGTGKTLLGRAIAGEAKVPFIHASGSDFDEMFVGVGAGRVRKLFAEAKKVAPAIIFIDEIDAVGSKRHSQDRGQNNMTLNQLLVEMDGFTQNDGIVVICATNLPEGLDMALTRPGRLDKTITVPKPDLKGRQEILDLYASKVVLADDVDISVMARRTVGWTGADLFNVLNLAAIKCSLAGDAAIKMEALEEAFDRVVVGLERRNPMADTERLMTAYHEAGHALVAWYSSSGDQVHKATIMPRGNALGITWQIPVAEKFSEKMSELEAKLAVAMGGKAAEVLIYGKRGATSGCASDLHQATSLARDMVMRSGMGISGTECPMYIGTETYRELSNTLKTRVDLAVQKLLNEAYVAAMKILTEKKEELERIALALVEYETISRDEIALAMEGKSEMIRSLRASNTSNTKKVTVAVQDLTPSLPTTAS